MKSFAPLEDVEVSKKEQEITQFWKENDLLEKTIENREGNEPFVFYEGPPTANGRPGIHHVIARTLKDAVCRYKTMQGYQVKRKAGWDTHGLPVEIEVEKKLDLNTKQEIEDYGIDKFNQKCRESVFEYESLWREMTDRMAYAIDLDNPYITLENDYIETIWWILDKFNKEDFIYQGHKILPYCPRCGTGLASHEVAQGYQEIKNITVTVKFKRKEKDEYFLSWTTTPWTLAANVSLTVNPEMTYLKVESEGEIYYVEETLADDVLNDDYEILEKMPGKELEGMEYEQLMPFSSPDKKAFYVTTADYVTAEEGTGIVHTAPAFGEDDYQTGRRYDLPVIQPVDEDGRYTTTPWQGEFVMDSDLEIEIMKWLYDHGKLYDKQKMAHNYPHCWRCDTPLIYYAHPGWYIEMTRLKDELIENNNGVDWYPDFVGEKRFGNWLENLKDWALSRSRYWGTPLNIWTCNDCNHITSVGSRKELSERALEDIDEDIELHRPYVDDIHLKCEECGAEMSRVEDVIDCWFDSGSMPFAQYHYPFENKELFAEQFPADFICEGIDQTRGWFYSLLAISTFVTGEAPYKRVLVNDLILDAEGKKMSKSRGNTVDPFELFDEYGADILRWYLLHVSPPWTPTKFEIEGLKETNSKFYSTIKNVYHFFQLYANTDNIDPREFSLPIEKRSRLDKWVLSRYNSLIAKVTENLEEYDLTSAVREIQDFIDEDLSNWYIRRSRRRFWASELNDDKKSVYLTTYELLEGLSRLIAPFAPFLAEDLYKNLTKELSVHLSDYPEADSSLVDKELENNMNIARTLVALGRSSRESQEIKVRQPLSKVIVHGEYKEQISDLIPLIKEEINVKEIQFVNDLDQYMEYELKPDFQKVGPILRDKVNLFAQKLSQLDAAATAKKLEAGETIELELDGEEFSATEEHVDIRINNKEGYIVAMEDDLFVILDIEITSELENEGLAREFISHIQQIRKEKDFDMMDNINIYYSGIDSEKITEAIAEFKDYIMDETLALKLEEISPTDEMKTYDLNGEKTAIKVEKITD
ncbi:MAG: isoleucine--tRNA ligase [Halanaerobiaceae bacterium]